MDFRSHSVGETSIGYFVKGVLPKLLLVSGVHGDEWESIPLLKKEVERYSKTLPDFVYIPVVSPSAVALRSRNNKWGEDVNRSFTGDLASEEVQAVQEILEQFQLELGVFFHEDPVRDAFYIYDWVRKDDGQMEARLKSYLAEINSAGVELMSDVDDVADATLGYDFINGYGRVDFTNLELGQDFEFMDAWMLKSGLCDRALTLEVPGLLPVNKKEEILTRFFQKILTFEPELLPELATGGII